MPGARFATVIAPPRRRPDRRDRRGRGDLRFFMATSLARSGRLSRPINSHSRTMRIGTMHLQSAHLGLAPSDRRRLSAPAGDRTGAGGRSVIGGCGDLKGAAVTRTAGRCSGGGQSRTGGALGRATGPRRFRASDFPGAENFHGRRCFACYRDAKCRGVGACGLAWNLGDWAPLRLAPSGNIAARCPIGPRRPASAGLWAAFAFACFSPSPAPAAFAVGTRNAASGRRARRSRAADSYTGSASRRQPPRRGFGGAKSRYRPIPFPPLLRNAGFPAPQRAGAETTFSCFATASGAEARACDFGCAPPTRDEVGCGPA